MTTTSMDFIEYDKTLHYDMVYNLAVKNNFHIDDIYANLNDFKCPPSFYKKFNTIYKNKNERNEMMRRLNAITQEKQDEWEVNGFLLMNDMKIIGFLFYNICKNNPVECELTFLLIDKDYKKNGYGSLAINYFFEKIKEFELIVRVKTEINEITWYKKFGFLEKKDVPFNDQIDGLVETKDDFHVLYYMTKKFLMFIRLLNNIINTQQNMIT